MSKSVSEIEKLLPILEMAFQAEQLKMAKIVARISALKKQIEHLDRPRPSNVLSAATRAGVDMRWATWAQQRKTLINQEIALASQERENVRTSVAAALSKLEAARQLRSHAMNEAQRLQLRRVRD